MTLENQALALYQTTFPDDPEDFAKEFISRFFEKNCRYTITDGRIASMLFLFECRLAADNKEYPVLYLYAAATLPEYRGRGMMKRLIGEAQKEADRSGSLLVTKPASDELFGFYGSCGFKTAFYHNETVYSAGKTVGGELKPVGWREYLSVREKLLYGRPHIILTETAEFALSGLSLFAADGLCAAVDMSEDRAVIKEWLSADNNCDIPFLCDGQAIVRTPEPITPFAMIYGDRARNLPEKMYFGLAMD